MSSLRPTSRGRTLIDSKGHTTRRYLRCNQWEPQAALHTFLASIQLVSRVQHPCMKNTTLCGKQFIADQMATSLKRALSPGEGLPPPGPSSCGESSCRWPVSILLGGLGGHHQHHLTPTTRGGGVGGAQQGGGRRQGVLPQVGLVGLTSHPGTPHQTGPVGPLQGVRVRPLLPHPRPLPAGHH